METDWIENRETHIPSVPQAAFLSLAGPDLSEKVLELIANQEVVAIVLYSDESGMRLALLPTGKGFRYSDPKELSGKTIESLRPLCVLNREVALKEKPAGYASTQQEQNESDKNLSERERYIQECEERITELALRLAERETMIDHREEMLNNREGIKPLPDPD